MLSLKQGLLYKGAWTAGLRQTTTSVQNLALVTQSMRYKSVFESRRKIKFHKMKKYPCVPNFMQEEKKDPFDYPLQTKEQVREQLVAEPLLDVKIGRKMKNPDGRPLDFPMSNILMEEETPYMIFDMNKLPLSSQQKERLKFLLGPRYTGKPEFKIKCRQFATYEQNFKRLREIVTELFLEAMRAPNVDIDSIRNPYKHDREKKKLGRTKEERDKKKAEMRAHKEAAKKLYQEEGKYLRYEQWREEIDRVAEEEKKIPFNQQNALQMLFGKHL